MNLSAPHGSDWSDWSERAEAIAVALRAHVSGRVEASVPLAPRTTLKVGGPALALVVAETPQDLLATARICASHEIDWLIVGRGSNLLVADTGWPGVVITLGRGFRGVQIDGQTAIAGGAERMPALAHAVARQGLGGLAFGVAIPGTVGGAVRMNAGAHGHDTSEVLAWVEVVRLSSGGSVQPILPEELQMTYRHTELPTDAVVVRAAFSLRGASDEQLAADMKEMQRWRREHQPLGEPSCGSVFRNPEGDSAGRLIDAAGLKGFGVGGARVSPKHANFITVESGAHARDVYAVIGHVRDEVARVHGVQLTPEVVIVGFDREATGP